MISKSINWSSCQDWKIIGYVSYSNGFTYEALNSLYRKNRNTWLSCSSSLIAHSLDSGVFLHWFIRHDIISVRCHIMTTTNRCFWFSWIIEIWVDIEKIMTSTWIISRTIDICITQVNVKIYYDRILKSTEIGKNSLFQISKDDSDEMSDTTCLVISNIDQNITEVVRIMLIIQMFFYIRDTVCTQCVLPIFSHRSSMIVCCRSSSTSTSFISCRNVGFGIGWHDDISAVRRRV